MRTMLDDEQVSGMRLPVRIRCLGILGLTVASLVPALASAHSEGTEASDPSSAPALLAFGGATRQYAALDSDRKPWRTAMPAPAPMNHADHAAPAGPADHSQHMGQMDHSQPSGDAAGQTEQMDHSQHTMPLEVEVRKPAADAHQGH